MWATLVGKDRRPGRPAVFRRVEFAGLAAAVSRALLLGAAPAAGAQTITSFSPTSGLLSQAVTIAGSGFTGAAAVKFNGTAASFKVVSGTKITTSVPDTASSGPISVTVGTKTATSSTRFTVDRG